jgi:ABC-type bacteriocin/lantibiotic exporter with double-glycine peptidase domain
LSYSVRRIKNVGQRYRRACPAVVHCYKQQFDTSCGITVTASLLDRYWNIPQTETDVYRTLRNSDVLDDNKEYIISFGTIINYLRQYKIAGRAYKMDWDQLEESLINNFSPIIINYTQPTPHFSLLLGIKDNYALVADPSKGFSLIEYETFMKSYSGNALLIASNTAKKNGQLINDANNDGNLRLKRLNQLSRYQRCFR